MKNISDPKVIIDNLPIHMVDDFISIWMENNLLSYHAKAKAYSNWSNDNDENETIGSQ